MLSVLLLSMVLLQAADAPAQAPAAPRRPTVRRDDTWSLDYEAGPMRLYRDATTKQAFWYATFTVTNRSGQDRYISPKWEIADEEGRVSAEGRDVPGDVQRAIQRLLNDPELQESHGVMGAIGQGPGGARSGFVVFPAGPEARRFSLYVAGLSNGEDSIKNVKTGERVTVRRTYRIDYQVPGDRDALRGPVPIAEPESGASNPCWIYR
jgi:hypothetical protein